MRSVLMVAFLAACGSGDPAPFDVLPPTLPDASRYGACTVGWTMVEECSGDAASGCEPECADQTQVGRPEDNHLLCFYDYMGSSFPCSPGDRIRVNGTEGCCHARPLTVPGEPRQCLVDFWVCK